MDNATKEFDSRFARFRYPLDPLSLRRSFTVEEVRLYISAKAQLPTDFPYPYRDVLSGFPREWWNPAIVELLGGPYAPRAQSFAEAAFEVARDLFVAAPEIAVRWIDRSRAFAWIRTHETRARSGLLRVVNDTHADWHWQAGLSLRVC